MLRAIASLAVPPLCAICAVPVASSERVCCGCRRGLARLGPVRSAVGGLEIVSAARYERSAQQLVARLKFSSRIALAEVASEAMAAALDRGEAGPLVPVPGSPARSRSRGFDAAQLLAAQVARRTGAPVHLCLARDDGPRQVGRPRTARTADPPRVRWDAAAAPLPPGTAWIVDDVATTGATLLSCAAVLRDHGAADVRALTFARA